MAELPQGVRVEGLTVTVELTEIELFTNLVNKTANLLHQIDICDFKDEIGHSLKRNVAYLEFIDFIENLGEKQ